MDSILYVFIEFTPGIPISSNQTLHHQVSCGLTIRIVRLCVSSFCISRIYLILFHFLFFEWDSKRFAFYVYVESIV